MEPTTRAEGGGAAAGGFTTSYTRINHKKAALRRRQSQLEGRLSIPRGDDVYRIRMWMARAVVIFVFAREVIRKWRLSKDDENMR